jgi:hypothetical protein
MAANYIFTIVDSTGETVSLEKMSYENAIEQSCNAHLAGTQFIVSHRDKTILHNIPWKPMNLVVFVIGPASLSRIKTELPLCGFYNAIYAITGKPAEDLGFKVRRKSQDVLNQEDINSLNIEMIKNMDLAHHDYSELLNGEIITETVGNKLFNVYFRGTDKFERLGSKIGMKRYITQYLYRKHYSTNTVVDYCCIDDSTCLLSSLNVSTTTPLENNYGFVEESFIKVDATKKITWMEAINQFLIDKTTYLFPSNFFYGFGKLSADGQILPVRKSDGYQHLIDTNSIYKILFADYTCMVENQIQYDPYCASMKEDVDWLIRTQIKGQTTFKKNNSITACKFNSNLCSPGFPAAQSKHLRINHIDLPYYYNLFNRMIMISRDIHKKIYYYVIPTNIFEPEKYTLLIGFGDTAPFDKLGMSGKIITAIFGDTCQALTPNETMQTLDNYDQYAEGLKSIYKSNQNNIYIYLPHSPKLLLNPGFKCGFASYTSATYEVMKAYGDKLVMPNLLYSTLLKSSSMPKRDRETSTIGERRSQRRKFSTDMSLVEIFEVIYKIQTKYF